MDSIKTFTSDVQDDGARLDSFVAAKTGLSRSLASRLIEEGHVMVDGSQRKPSFRLPASMNISVSLPEENKTGLAPQDIELKIIYEDDDIIVIDKPAGISVHPGAGISDHTLVNALLKRYPEIRDVGDSMRPGIVHRLDKMTSGVMVAARNKVSYEKLSEGFKAHTHKRIYYAVCYGKMNAPSGRIETLFARNPANRKKMTSRVSEGRSAVTLWEVVEQFREFSLLKLTLLTGRTHQIRVHLCETGHPVMGDDEYSGKNRVKTIIDPKMRSVVKQVGRQMLHAGLLGINHPVKDVYMEFTSEVPEDMAQMINTLRVDVEQS